MGRRPPRARALAGRGVQEIEVRPRQRSTGSGPRGDGRHTAYLPSRRRPARSFLGSDTIAIGEGVWTRRSPRAMGEVDDLPIVHHHRRLVGQACLFPLLHFLRKGVLHAGSHLLSSWDRTARSAPPVKVAPRRGRGAPEDSTGARQEAGAGRAQPLGGLPMVVCFGVRNRNGCGGRVSPDRPPTREARRIAQPEARGVERFRGASFPAFRISFCE
jgi:hypothetical protein